MTEGGSCDVFERRRLLDQAQEGFATLLSDEEPSEFNLPLEAMKLQFYTAMKAAHGRPEMQKLVFQRFMGALDRIRITTEALAEVDLDYVLGSYENWKEEYWHLWELAMVDCSDILRGDNQEEPVDEEIVCCVLRYIGASYEKAVEIKYLETALAIMKELQQGQKMDDESAVSPGSSSGIEADMSDLSG